MDIGQIISTNASQPLPHQLLASWLKDYKRPNDKIMALRAEGLLEPLKKGLYIAGPKAASTRPENILLANHMLGPSYVSMETALSYYGLIPERVYETASMTTKTSREFQTGIGLFTYTRLTLPYYAFGLQTAELAPQQFAMIACPEKALCDKIVSTSGLILRSIGSTYTYLTDNLRMEEDALKRLDAARISTWLAAAPKKDSLQMVVNLIESL